MMYEQVKLSYNYDGLEPFMDAETVETHYGKHHATYTANLNSAAEAAGVADKPIEKLLAELDTVADEAQRTALRNNGGGFYNHNLFFEQLTPGGAVEPTGKLREAIDETFGSFEELKAQMTALALGQFGSGWAWLSTDAAGKLYVSKSANQDNPISLGTGHMPIFTIDVWEHAYYLKYKNLRASYVENLWNLVNWDVVGERYGR
ncbi:MAG: superoxide dismutase [Lachnospiraceae bacterium]|nr:superoxide dismutase [Lachnospiraceae bacterium]